VLQTNDGYIPSNIKKPSGQQSTTKKLHSTTDFSSSEDKRTLNEQSDGTDKETAKVNEQDCRPKLQRSALASDFFGHEYFYDGDIFVANHVSAQRVNAFQDQIVQQLFESSRTEMELRAKLDNTFINPSTVIPLWKEFHANDLPKVPDRVADFDFKIKETPFDYTYDLELFCQHVDRIFTWHEDSEERKKYMAPYFPLVQSSGMGKTKLLYEYQKIPKNDIDSRLILCKLESSSDNKKDIDDKEYEIYNDCLLVPCGKTNAVREIINQKLAKIVQSIHSKKVVLCFDESQALLESEAFSFRCIRWWLRLQQEKQVVAVFSGTNSKLASFYYEAPLIQSSRGSCTYYTENGKDMYQPFYKLSTSGIIANYDTNFTSSGRSCKFAAVSQYGRPLLALLDWSEDTANKNIYVICRRMLLQSNANEWSDAAYFNVLGSRVQFGQTNLQVASELTANAYALLTHFDYKSQVAFINFPPEPICAHIAMCLMVDGWQVESSPVVYRGKHPKTWMKKAEELYSKGIASPPKGDTGKIAGALYMLFCGDVLRYSLDKTLLTLRVPFEDWVGKLLNPDSINLSQKESGLFVNIMQVSCWAGFLCTLPKLCI
jgi:hypothetical protein